MIAILKGVYNPSSCFRSAKVLFAADIKSLFPFARVLDAKDCTFRLSSLLS